MPEPSRRVFQILVRASAKDVWREITRTDAPMACFFNNRMHLGPGGLAPGTKLAMRTPDGRYTGVVGEILAFEPPTRFSHTFRFTSMDDPECKVTYELKPVEGGTEFTLIIDDLLLETKTAKQMLQGGTMICNTLKAVLETGRPTLGIRLLYGLFRLLLPLSPKRCRSENWPL